MLHSAVPAVLERVKAPLAPIIDPLLQYPVPSQGSSQSSPLDMRAASLALTLHCPVIPESLQVIPKASQLTSSPVLEALEGFGWELATGNTDSVQTTAGKQFWVRLQ